MAQLGLSIVVKVHIIVVYLYNSLNWITFSLFCFDLALCFSQLILLKYTYTLLQSCNILLGPIVDYFLLNLSIFRRFTLLDVRDITRFGKTKIAHLPNPIWPLHSQQEVLFCVI